MLPSTLVGLNVSHSVESTKGGNGSSTPGRRSGSEERWTMCSGASKPDHSGTTLRICITGRWTPRGPLEPEPCPSSAALGGPTPGRPLSPKMTTSCTVMPPSSFPVHSERMRRIHPHRAREHRGPFNPDRQTAEAFRLHCDQAGVLEAGFDEHRQGFQQHSLAFSLNGNRSFAGSW